MSCKKSRMKQEKCSSVNNLKKDTPDNVEMIFKRQQNKVLTMQKRTQKAIKKEEICVNFQQVTEDD